MKLVCFVNIGGVDTLKVITTADSVDTTAAFVKSKPGVGKPFLVYESLSGTVLGAEFEGEPLAPIVSADVAANKTAIETMIAAESVAAYQALLTYA